CGAGARARPVAFRAASRRDPRGRLGTGRAAAPHRRAGAPARRPLSAGPPYRPLRARAPGVARLPPSGGVPRAEPGARRAPPRLVWRRAALGRLGLGLTGRKVYAWIYQILFNQCLTVLGSRLYPHMLQWRLA